MNVHVSITTGDGDSITFDYDVDDIRTLAGPVNSPGLRGAGIKLHQIADQVGAMATAVKPLGAVDPMCKTCGAGPMTTIAMRDHLEAHRP